MSLEFLLFVCANGGPLVFANIANQSIQLSSASLRSSAPAPAYKRTFDPSNHNPVQWPNHREADHLLGP